MNMLSDRIKQKRLEKGWTQAEVANAVGVGRDSYNKYEKGKQAPPYDTLISLAKKYQTSTDFLLTGHLYGLTEDGTPVLDKEAWALMEELHRRPDLKSLFSTSKLIGVDIIKQVDQLLRTMLCDERGEATK
jgi:transcriptional regulator with XRE-family HTH domain